MTSVRIPENTLTAAQSYFKAELADRFETDELVALSRIVFEKIDAKGPRLQESDLVKIVHIIKRLKQNEPLQYILQEAYFFNEPFKVTQAVLIPRPETEELVEWILSIAPATLSAAAQILDIGTGSGCIAITLQQKWPSATVSGLDVSAEALAIAQYNAIQKQVQVQWIQHDFFTYQPGMQFDVLVSNPPYIAQAESQTMAANVLNFEPHLALFVSDQQPLVFYQGIAEFGWHHLKTGGHVFVELNPLFAHQVLAAFTAKGYQDVELKLDLSGNYRFLHARR